MLHVSENQSRLIARIVWEALKAERFETLADLTAEVKTRCARLRLRVTADDLNEAYTLVESNTPLIALPQRERLAVESPDAGIPLSAVDARAVLADIRTRLGTAVQVKDIPSPAPAIDPRRVDRAKALRLVAGEIKAAAERCDALEHEVEHEVEPPC